MASDRSNASPEVHGQRLGRTRDRRGRGPRGVIALPGPLSPAGLPIDQSRRAAFDLLVSQVLTKLDSHFEREAEHVQIVVEEAPKLPDRWTDPVPLSIVNPTRGGHQIVLYRLPLLGRAEDAEQVAELVWTVLLTRLGEVWNHDPEDLDPR